jgi:hypothetical protein
MTLLPKVASPDRELAVGTAILFLISVVLLVAGLITLGFGVFAFALTLSALRR